MKTEKIIWGLIMIFIGGVFLLDNFNVIDFYWSSVWRFWPVIFILIGANMLFNRLEDKTSGPLLAAGITVAVLAFIGYQGVQPNDSKWSRFTFKNRGKSSGDWSRSDSFVEPFSGSKYASLNIQGGATSFRLLDSTVNLFEAKVKEPMGGYSLEKTVIDSTEVLNFRGRDRKRGVKIDNMQENETRLMINTNPIWDIKVEMGAGSTKLRLEDFKVRNLSFEGGAASFSARVGSRLPLTEVSVEAGVASIRVEVPRESGTRIRVDTGLSSRDFPGFVKQGDGSYQTPNYDSAANKINIRLEGGLSSFEVRKY